MRVMNRGGGRGAYFRARYGRARRYPTAPQLEDSDSLQPDFEPPQAATTLRTWEHLVTELRSIDGMQYGGLTISFSDWS